MTTCVWSGQVTFKPGGNRQLDFVGKADAKLQFVFLHGGQVADAHDFQLLLVALRDADHHVLHQRRGSGRAGRGPAACRPCG